MGAESDLRDWEPRESLLAAAADYRLTGTRLSRLHRSGLIPRPRTRSLGRGRGKQSFYPPGTRTRLLRVLEVGQEVRSFADLAWRLWWEDGGEVSEAVRARLRRVAGEWEAYREELSELLAGEDAEEKEAEDKMESVYRELERDRLPPRLGGMRRNVGPASFASVFRVLAEVFSGRFAGYGETEDEEETGREELVERAFGIDRARSEALADGEPWFEGSSEEDMLSLSALVDVCSLSELAEADEADLNAAREELHAFVDNVVTVTSVVSKTLGPAAGLGTAVFRDMRAGEQATLLIFWLMLRTAARLREEMSSQIAVHGEAEALRILHEGLVEWREEIPAYAEVFSDESLAAALRDPGAQARLDEELRRLYLDHGPEVDRFVDRRPELRRAMARFE